MSDKQELDKSLTDASAVFSDGSTGVEIEDVSPPDKITRPFDPTLIRVETHILSIDLIVTRIQEGEIDLVPSFQRKGGIWKEDAQSRLIESMLIRIPLPAFYLDASEENCWVVVDGLQRLTALKRFIIDKNLRLIGLEFLTNLNGSTYDNLPRNFQRRIKETQITAYLIQEQTPPTVKFNIFKRINTGGLPLSSQEIRHALNQGAATELLAELTNTKEFLHAIDYGISDDRMADRECVLRYLAFSINLPSNYNVNDLDAFLNNNMAQLNSMSKDEISDLRKKFKRTMVAAKGIFGYDAFRKRYTKISSRYPINKALFEAWSVNISKLSDKEIKELVKKRENLKGDFIKLMNDVDFDRAISQGTGSIKRVKKRFQDIENLIRGVLK